MNFLRVAAASGGWDATQWVALVGVLGAIVGPLLGVWLGKRLEKRSQRDAYEQAELLEQTRALKEALTHVELLLPNIDPVFVVKKLSAGLPLPDIAATEESRNLQARQEQVELLLVQASMLPVSEDVGTLLDQLRTSVREGVLAAVAVLAEIARNEKNGELPALRDFSNQRTVKLRQLADALRENLNMALPQRTEELRGSLIRLHGLLPWAPGAVTTTNWDRLVEENAVRIIETPDILSNLPERLNLLELPPDEFVALIADLFTRIGFKTALIRNRPDAGADVLAFNQEPLLGGKVVIQVKRYRMPVPVAAVRELLGMVVEERAVKGILVTTSDFTRAGYALAQDRPIELLSGANVLYLLSRYAGIEAEIK
jgi:Restriction endonuclease